MMFEPEQTFPDFYIVGAAKAGTTAVWTWLQSHPDVFLPAVKEPGFFAFVGGRPAPRSGPFDPSYVSRIAVDRESYAALYEDAGARLAGDVSPIYLMHEKAAARIASVRPDARIVILLRDPVRRAFSQYLHHLRDGLEPCDSFEAALAAEPERLQSGWSWGHGYASVGQYAAQIKRYTDAFPREQILFLDYQHLQSAPEQCWQQLCAHLGLRAQPMPQNARVNATASLAGVPARPGITRALRQPGQVQRLLKVLIPPALRKRLRGVLEGASKEVPVLSEATSRALATRYAPERQQIQALAGLSLAEWTHESGQRA